jgi:hypothetical protein
MDNELIRKIVEFVEEASPIIWAAVQRQVAVTVVLDLIWAALFLALTIGLVYGCIRCRNKYLEDTYRNDAYSMSAIFLVLGAAVTTFMFVFLFNNALSHLLNPDYHAIKILIDLFPGT